MLGPSARDGDGVACGFRRARKKEASSNRRARRQPADAIIFDRLLKAGQQVMAHHNCPTKLRCVLRCYLLSETPSQGATNGLGVEGKVQHSSASGPVAMARRPPTPPPPPRSWSSPAESRQTRRCLPAPPPPPQLSQQGSGGGRSGGGGGPLAAAASGCGSPLAAAAAPVGGGGGGVGVGVCCSSFPASGGGGGVGGLLPLVAVAGAAVPLPLSGAAPPRESPRLLGVSLLES